MSSSVWQAVDRFFHARTKNTVVWQVTGILRIGYALLVLFDRLLLTLDFDHFFLHTMPISVSSRHLYPSLLWLAPDNALFYYCVHAMTFVFAMLLLIGIAPRLQLAGLLVTMSAFWTHNSRIWDSQDNILRFWGVFLMFLPLKSISIYDKFAFRQQENHNDTRTSWPMWPFRIWQFQLMAIYACAGLAKLAVPEWQNGTAMLHVVQTTDFYGGVFNPDWIFNRMGPLMLMTYLSLLIECASLVTAWVWPTPTVIAMFGLHLGIELAMNMHCLEWLCMLGWLTFLVQPEEEPQQSTVHDDSPLNHDESMETVEVLEPPDEATETTDVPALSKPTTNDDDASSSQMKAISTETPSHQKVFKLRHLGTSLLIYVGLVIFLETAPLERVHGLLPTAVHPYLDQSIALQKKLAARIAHPVTTPLRLRQAGWYMYSYPPVESYRYEIIVRHLNGNQTVWESPKWETMTWYERKRWIRTMSFYDCLGQASWQQLDAFMRHIARQYENVASLELYQHREAPVVLPNDMEFGFFKEALQPLARFDTNHWYTLNLCADLDAQCGFWAAEGYCNWPIGNHMSSCRYSCGYCKQTVDDLSQGTRVAIIWPYDNQFFRATVRRIKKYSRPLVQLEYDNYNTETDRYEWLDQHLLWQRGLIILNEELTSRPAFSSGHDEL